LLPIELDLLGTRADICLPVDNEFDNPEWEIRESVGHTADIYVQGTVLLVLRKRLGNEIGFIARLQRPVENAVYAKLEVMRALDRDEEPNFGDADYQLAAYAAGLEVLTRYSTIDNRPVAVEVLRDRKPGEVSPVARLLQRAVRIASDFLVPDGLARDAWADLSPEERFYLKGLDLERAGESRSAAYQEMARGFGVQDYRAMLGSAVANKVRLKTAKEFGRRDLRRAASQDRAEDRALEGFAGASSAMSSTACTPPARPNGSNPPSTGFKRTCRTTGRASTA
jgi:hypothetical protein